MKSFPDTLVLVAAFQARARSKPTLAGRMARIEAEIEDFFNESSVAPKSNRPRLMKHLICYFLLVVVTVVQSRAADLISIADFKKMDPIKREEIIRNAPPEQKDELIKIHTHLYLLGYYGGEEGLKKVKESYAASARGFVRLESCFNQQEDMWERYRAAVDSANEKAGMPAGKMAEVGRELWSQEVPIKNRLGIIHSLVFNLAASPAAMELEKNARILDDELERRLVSDTSTPNKPITEQERVKFDKRFDEMFEELRKLPVLSPEQVQKEYDDFPEEKIRAFGLNEAPDG